MHHHKVQFTYFSAYVGFLMCFAAKIPRIKYEIPENTPVKINKLLQFITNYFPNQEMEEREPTYAAQFLRIIDHYA